MNASVMIVYYFGMSGHPVISHAANFLFDGATEMSGSSIEEIEFYADVPSLRAPQPANQAMYDRWQEHYKNLPGAWFNKKKSLVEVSYKSKQGFQEDLIGDSCKESTPELFATACNEVVTHIEFASHCLEGIYGIDWDRLVSHAKKRLRHMPATDVDLSAALTALRALAKKNLLP